MQRGPMISHVARAASRRPEPYRAAPCAARASLATIVGNRGDAQPVWPARFLFGLPRLEALAYEIARKPVR